MERSRQAVRRTAASGKEGAVATARLESAEAAVRMLEAGGNAVDAAVAAGFVAGVVEPMETTIAGSGFMLVFTPDDGHVRSLEFAPRAPGAARPQMFAIDAGRAMDRGLGVSVVVGDENVQGIKASGIPATLVGLLEAHSRWGRLPRATILAPAIALAYEGFKADSYFALEVPANLSALRSDPGASAAFLVNGDPPAAAHLGDASLGTPPIVRQAALGKTLEVLASKGEAAYIQGEIGEQLIDTVRALGGILSRNDLLAAVPKVCAARRLPFRGHDIWAPTAPCSTLTQYEILEIWAALHPSKAQIDDTPERIERFAAASWHAFADRYHWLGDPDVVPVPEAGLLSDAYAKSVAGAITEGEALPRASANEGAPWDVFARRAVHDPWQYQAISGSKPIWRPEGGANTTAGTTHISAIDRNGMAVSLTHTAANHFGSKVVCSRTGLLLDAAMGWFNARSGAANSIAGLKRPLANMGPLLVSKNGRPVAALGAPGGRRIINAVVQIVLNLVERGMNAEDAVNAPRIDARRFNCSGLGAIEGRRSPAR